MNILEEIHQENLDDVPARRQWQVRFEVPRQPPGPTTERLAELSVSGNFPGIWPREIELLRTSSNRRGLSGQLWWPAPFREPCSNASKEIESTWIG